MSISLTTQRLLLRPLTRGDISQFVPLIGEFDVSKNLSQVPYPYTEENGAWFVDKMAEGHKTGTDYALAIILQPDRFVGICGIHPERNWEFGYWIGRPHWGKGYATEAGHRAVQFAFDDLKAEALNAGWFHDNPASGRVLQKLGFHPTGEGERDSASRGAKVNCHLVALDRATYMTRKMTP